MMSDVAGWPAHKMLNEVRPDRTVNADLPQRRFARAGSAGYLTR